MSTGTLQTTIILPDDKKVRLFLMEKYNEYENRVNSLDKNKYRNEYYDALIKYLLSGILLRDGSVDIMQIIKIVSEDGKVNVPLGSFLNAVAVIRKYCGE